MAIINASAATASFFASTSQSADFNSFVSSSSTLYAWNSSGGHRIVAIGTGISTNGSNVPTGGTITSITIDISNNSPLNPDIVITDLDLDLTDFEFASGASANDTFWELVLEGETEFTGSTGANVVINGDGNDVEEDEAFAGGNDLFNLASGNTSNVSGDFFQVRDGLLFGGDDTFVGQGARVVGDFDDVSGASIVFAGDDTITLTGNLGNAPAVYFGDTVNIDSTSEVYGGNDIIDLSGATPIIGGSANLVGDANILSGTALLEGGNDILIAPENYNARLWGDAFQVSTNATGIGGDDTLIGGAGNDELYGDFKFGGFGGDDRLFGGDGNDEMYGGGGDDQLYGGDGNDTLYAGDGIDVLRGGDGNDRLFADSGVNTLEGGAGNDTITIDGGQNEIKMGSGFDTIDVSDGTNYLDFSDDFGGVNISGLDFNETLNFGSLSEGVVLRANYYLRFGSGVEMTSFMNGASLIGTKHNDIFQLASELSEIDAGSGVDLLDLSVINQTFVVDLGAGTLKSGPTYSIENFENVRGGDFGDSLTGSDDVNLIYGHNGNDTLFGLEGKDRLFDGEGDDQVFGGADNDYVRVGDGANSFFGGSGKDYLSYFDSEGGVTIDLSKNAVSGSWADDDQISGFESVGASRYGNDSVIGTSGSNSLNTYSGDDRVKDLGGNDKVNLGRGNDYVRVGGGKDSYDGAGGIDYISYYDSSGGINLNLATNEVSGSWANNDIVKNFESASGSKVGSDTLRGTDGFNDLRGYGGDDLLSGKGGNDVLRGGNDDDRLYGASGADRLYGGSGEDFLDGGGGSGTDRLYGGSGDDVFHFDRGEGNDIVKDFENNDDTIEFDNFSTFSTVAGALSFAEEVGPHVFFDFGSDGTLLVENTTINRLVNDIDIV